VAFLVFHYELNTLSQDDDKPFLDVRDTFNALTEIKHMYSRLTLHNAQTSSSILTLEYPWDFSTTLNPCHIPTYVNISILLFSSDHHIRSLLTEVGYFPPHKYTISQRTCLHTDVHFLATSPRYLDAPTTVYATCYLDPTVWSGPGTLSLAYPADEIMRNASRSSHRSIARLWSTSLVQMANG
jgi:hypothetical protein